MNLKSVFILLVAVAAGVIGGSLAYQVAVPAESAAPATESIVLKSPGHRARADQRPVKFAPCRKPAKLEGKRCVADVVRTVSVPQSSARASAARPVAPAPAAPAPATSGSAFNDDGRHHGGDDEAGHDGDDDGDDEAGHDGDDDDSDTRSADTGTHTGTQTRTRSHD